MDYDWYAWKARLYRRDTLHLTYAEHGAYRALIDAYMMDIGGPLPNDDRALAILSGGSLDEWLIVAPKVRPFFKVRGGRLWHKRCEAELDRMDKLMQRRSEAGKKGAEERHLKSRGLAGKRIANARQNVGTGTGTGTRDKKEDADATRVSLVRAQVLKIMDEASNGTWVGDASRVPMWLSSGADPDLDIYPTMRTLLSRKNGQGPPTSLKYFERAIADALATRIKPMPEGNPNGQSQQAGPGSREELSAAVAARLAERDRQDLERRSGGDVAPVLPAVQGKH